jgi:hypothetical protein
MERVEDAVVMHRKAERPSELNNWEAYVMGPDCLARCIIKRDDMRTLLRYVRQVRLSLQGG